MIFGLVIELNRKCLHARIRSRHRSTPRYREVSDIAKAQQGSLADDIKRFMSRSSKGSSLIAVNQKLEDLCTVMKAVENCSPRSEEESQMLKRIVKCSYELCTPDGQPISETLSSYGLNPKTYLTDSTLKQINKVGRYWGLCVDLARAAHRYRNLFKTFDLQLLPPYQDYIPNPSLRVNGKVTYHVHAEIQLLVFYDLHSNSDFLKPRILGVSKAACYLCSLFIAKHLHFRITKTHGKLYHQWTFPNLNSYSIEQSKKYRRILTQINTELAETIRKEKARKSKRPILMESYVHLPLKFLPSATASDARTLTSQASLSDCVESSSQRQSFREPPQIEANEETEARSEILQESNERLDLIKSDLSGSRSEQLSHPPTSPCQAPNDSNVHATFVSLERSTGQIDVISADPNSSSKKRPYSLNEEYQTQPKVSDNFSSPSNSSLSSSTIVLSPKHSISKNITATAPFQTKTDTTYFAFELDPPGQGTVQISMTAENEKSTLLKEEEDSNRREQREAQEQEVGFGQEDGKPAKDKYHKITSQQTTEIDITTLPLNQPLEISTEDQGSSNTIVLNLGQPHGPTIQLHLQWL